MQSREQVFKYPNATVRVHIPDLADDERIKREKELRRSAEILLREVIKNEYTIRNDSASKRTV